MESSSLPSKPKLELKVTLGGQADEFAHLNPQQRGAIFHDLGPALVIAGAGTGKTRVITERIAYLIQSGKARTDEILGLTFTEKAAFEMQERLDVLMPLGYSPVALKTFHAFCDETLRCFGIDIGIPSNYKILQGVEQWQFLKEHLFDFDLRYYRPMGNPTKFIDALTSHFSKLKEELVTPEAYLEHATTQLESAEAEEDRLEAEKHVELAKAFQLYQSLLIEANYLDFSDLQFKVIELFEKRPNVLKHLQNTYRYLLVDEYQDTNIAQNKIVDLLAAGHRNLMAVGDDDQSIYKFRGAAISNILQFKEAYSDLKTFVLTENYRSDQQILDAAYTSIQNNNPDRLEERMAVVKKLKGQRPGTAESIKSVHCSTIEQEVEYVVQEIKSLQLPLSEIAILCRSNAQAHPFIEALKQHNIAYQFPSEKGLYDKKEIRDLIALLRVISNPTDDISFYRVLRMSFWKLPMETILGLIQTSKKHFTSIWQQVKNHEQASFLASTLKDLIEHSKNHSVGEVLYRFTETVQLYQQYLAHNSVEAEDQIFNIAAFFERLRAFERDQQEHTVVDFVAYLDLAQEAGDNPAARFEVEGREGVQISSVHASKGLEFNTVFLVGFTDDRFPSRNRKDLISMPDALVREVASDRDAHLQEERRLFYVAVTRAKERLHLCYSDFYNPSSAQKPRSKKPSRFLKELEGRVEYTQIEKTVESVESFLKPQRPVFPSEQSRGDSRTEIKQFSYSQLSTFERCPRQYQYQYLFKIPSPPAANLSFGSSLHNTLQDYYKLVSQSKQASLFTDFDPDLSLEKLLSIYEEKWIDRGYETKQHMELRKQRGEEILTLFYERFKNDIPQVEYLEKGFRLKIDDYVISGRIDRADKRADGSLHIIDYKTGRSRTEKQVQEDLQLAIYALAADQCFGIPASLLTLHFLDADESVSVEPSEETMRKAADKVRSLAKEINESDFGPKPARQTCQFCPYKRICDASVG